MAQSESQALQAISTETGDQYKINGRMGFGERHSRELILIVQHTIMCWSGGSKETTMALQIEVELGRVNHIAIHNGASRAIPTPIRDVGCREEANVMAFPDNNDCNRRGYS